MQGKISGKICQDQNAALDFSSCLAGVTAHSFITFRLFTFSLWEGTPAL